MNIEIILKDLREQFGQQTVLYAEDIAKLLGEDHRVVQSLLKANSLPITVKKVRTRLGVSIYEVAEWLATSDETQSKSKLTSETKVKRPSKKRPSLGKSLIALKTQMDFIAEIIIELNYMEEQREEVRSMEKLMRPTVKRKNKRLT